MKVKQLQSTLAPLNTCANSQCWLCMQWHCTNLVEMHA